MRGRSTLRRLASMILDSSEMPRPRGRGGTGMHSPGFARYGMTRVSGGAVETDDLEAGQRLDGPAEDRHHLGPHPDDHVLRLADPLRGGLGLAAGLGMSPVVLPGVAVAL